MNNILIGITIGLMTSMIAGLLLMWRGNHTIAFLQRFPAKYRISVMTLAYVRALKGFPYRFVHLFALMTLFFVQVGVAFGYVSITYTIFCQTASSDSSEGPAPEVEIETAPFDQLAKTAFEYPWGMLAITLLVLLFTWNFAKRLIVESAVPFAHRDFATVRELVAKCATKKQFVMYIESESKAETTDALVALLDNAQDLIKEAEVALIQEMIDSISVKDTTTAPATLPDTNPGES